MLCEQDVDDLVRRLHTSNQYHESAVRKSQNQIISQELRELTFQPQLTSSTFAKRVGQTGVTMPIDQRVRAHKTEREQKLGRLQAEMFDSEMGSFLPGREELESMRISELLALARARGVDIAGQPEPRGVITAMEAARKRGEFFVGAHVRATSQNSSTFHAAKIVGEHVEMHGHRSYDVMYEALEATRSLKKNAVIAVKVDQPCGGDAIDPPHERLLVAVITKANEDGTFSVKYAQLNKENSFKVHVHDSKQSTFRVYELKPNHAIALGPGGDTKLSTVDKQNEISRTVISHKEVRTRVGDSHSHPLLTLRRVRRSRRNCLCPRRISSRSRGDPNSKASPNRKRLFNARQSKVASLRAVVVSRAARSKPTKNRRMRAKPRCASSCSV